MEIKKIIDEFLEEVLVKNHYDTYTCYSSHLKCFYKFCETKKILKVEDVKEKIFLEYVKYCKEFKLSNRTINKRYRLFIQVLKFKKIDISDFEKNTLKEKNIRFDMFNACDLKKIVNYVYNLKEDKINLTHKLAIFLLMSTGARINELLNIEKQNIDFSDNSILLTVTKTDVDRYVFFDKYTAELLKKYLEYDNDSKYLLFNYYQNKRYTYRTCRCFLEKMKKELEIDKLHPHMFRHTFASNLVLNEAPLFMIKELLGHSSIRTTEIYVHMNKNNLKKCHDKFYHIA